MAGGLLMSVLWIAFMCLHQSLQQQDMKCDPGQYGHNCEEQCSAGCPGGQCDNVTGHCNDNDCLPGWWSGYLRCDQACGHGRYGKGCSRLCNGGCKDGSCNRTDGSCVCWLGWTGQSCDVCPEDHYINRRWCRKCSEGCQSGTCRSGGACDCLPGWSGSDCRTDVNECLSSPCQNYGTCHDAVNSYTCTCQQGYTGLHCEEDINECESNPCQNEGTCVNTQGSYTCHCPPGFRGDECKQECWKVTYGQDCSERCGEGCDGGECDKVTGHCQCRSVGWKGPKCDACAEGYYMTTEQQSSYPYVNIKKCELCGQGCEAGRCDTSNGHCQCQPGWRTRTHRKTCDEKCRSGTYGPACNKRCSRGCETRHCDHINGECNCRSDRWTGPTCDECQDGYYGDDCSQSCGFCADDKPCEKTTGHCERCKGSKEMPFCKADCEDGKFGDNCLKDCGRCAEEEVCDKINGHCTACEPGWKPPLCSDRCEDGHYGQQCSRRCGHCENDDVCDAVMGFCPAGCKGGFHGLRCDRPTQAANLDKLFMVVGVSSTVVAVLLAVVAVLVYRSRRAHQAPRTKDRIGEAEHGGADMKKKQFRAVWTEAAPFTPFLFSKEAGAQENSLDPEMGGNLPRLPGEEDGIYTDVTSSACSPSADPRVGDLPRLPGEEDGIYSDATNHACSSSVRVRDLPRLRGEEDGIYSDATNHACSSSARDRDLPRLRGEEDGIYSDATNHACSSSASARAREAQPAAVATAASSKESGGVDGRKGRTPGPSKPLGGRGMPLRNRQDQTFGFGGGQPGKMPLQAAAMANDPEEPAQASFPSFELASIFSPHPTEDLAGDVPYENVGFPAHVMASYERPMVYVNTAEDPHLYEKSQAVLDDLYDDCSDTRV